MRHYSGDGMGADSEQVAAGAMICPRVVPNSGGIHYGEPNPNEILPRAVPMPFPSAGNRA